MDIKITKNNTINWSTYVDNFKPVSELPQEIKDELGL